MFRLDSGFDDRFTGQGPIAQFLQSSPSRMQDAIATGPLFGLGFEKVFDAGQGVGQGLHLHHIRNPALGQQLAFGKAANGLQIVGRFRQLDDAQGAGHLLQKFRRVLELIGIPT